MSRPKVPGDEDVRPVHRRLVEQLAALPAADRELIVRAARGAAQTPRRHTVQWRHLRDACGVVRLGGDAVADTRALYDG